MCELFAINSKRPVRANAYLPEFFSHSVDHPHGWGMSWRTSPDPFDDTAVILHREPVRAVDSSLLPTLLEQPIDVTRMIAHIRKSTCGQQTAENCHPFRGTDMTGREWTQIHNGILFNEELLAGYDQRGDGETDSERTLLFLLDVLDEAALRNGGRLDFDTRFNTLAGALSQLTNLNRLNLILDDGEYTYVHTNTSEDTLHFLELHDDAGDPSLIFSTRPLAAPQKDDGDEKNAPSADWRPVPHNRLIAYRDGRLVRTSAPHGYVFCEAILDLRRKFGDNWQSAVA